MAKKRRRSRRASKAAASPAGVATDASGAAESGGTDAPRGGAHAAPSPPASPESPAGRRRGANFFIGAFLAYQVLMPLGYYLGDGGYDERFSWRMFSSVRMRRCRVDVHEVDAEVRAGLGGERARRVDLSDALHVAWIRVLRRGRPAVVRKFLERRCARDGMAEARYRLRCRDTDGSLLPERRVELDCESGRFTTSESGG